ncbi:hypothetical protein HYC85_013565 [Camellia sinensis]|uniref:cellulase n=1 Tax=Camellia sinensis TaxID=4442 RepID=A0A7J7H7A2_CAMSI|nr:hypothetical protein HYC85_013565 [Camellia sinensis]
MGLPISSSRFLEILDESLYGLIVEPPIDKFRGSYNDGLRPAVCPFYCSRNGYQDELIWAAAWLHKATKATYYWNYVTRNIHSVDSVFAEFGWDAKHAGINILLSKFVLDSSLFRTNADKFVCSVLPESPTKSVTYSPSMYVCYIIK